MSPPIGPGGDSFASLKNKLAKRPGVRNQAALTAYIERKNLAKKNGGLRGGGEKHTPMSKAVSRYGGK